MRAILPLISLLALTNSFAASAGDLITGPVPGFVFDAPSNSLRPILGSRGAASLGNPLASGLDIASIAPDGDSALAIQSGRVVLITGLSSAAPSLTDAGASIAAASRITWNGNVAAIFSPSQQQAMFFDRNANTSWTMDFTTVLPASAVSVVASADGALIAALDGGGLYRITADGQASALASGTGIPAMYAAGTDLYYCDAATGSVFLIQTSGSPQLIISGLDPVVAMTLNGSQLVLASNTTMTLFDLAAGQTISATPLPAPPSWRLERAGPNLFLTNQPGAGEPYYFASLSVDPAVIFFVPPPAGGNQ